MEKRVYILGACRTPIGKMGGALSEIPAVDLGALVIKESLKRAGIVPKEVDHVLMGCVLQSALGQNVARQAAVKAGLPYSTTAETINVVCGSGLDCVNHAARMIQTGDADVVVAGGMENMSMAPFALPQARFGYRMGFPMKQSNLVDTMVNDGLWDAINNYHMGITAENVAKQWGITREELDDFSVRSQNRACRAIESGAFRDETVPVKVKIKRKEQIIDTDEGPRSGTTMETLAALKPAFDPAGIVTAGNSSGINDGAAAVVLVSEEKLSSLGLKPMAEWIDGALGGVDPSIMGIGPVASTRKLLKRQNLAVEDIDLVEANEAFAAQSIAVARELNFDENKLNVNGGAIALGHPIGASGCRILVTLLYAMKARKAKTGLATLCIGGGMGCSTLVRRIEE